MLGQSSLEELGYGAQLIPKLLLGADQTGQGPRVFGAKVGIQSQCVSTESGRSASGHVSTW